MTQIQAGANWWWLTRAGKARQYDWSGLDRLVAAAEARELSVVLQVQSTPDWVHPDLVSSIPHDQRIWYPPLRSQTELEHWQDFIRDLLARYRGRVAHYEIWNEPNIREFWRPLPSVEDYARLLRATYLTAKGVDPEAVIVSGGLSRNDLGYLEAYYEAADRLYGPEAAASDYYFDVLGVHPYSDERSPLINDRAYTHQGQYGEVDRNFPGYRRMKALVDRREPGTDKRLFLGEYGFSTVSGWWPAVADDVRARYLEDAFELAASEPYVSGLAWYSYAPEVNNGGWAGGWAIVDDNGGETETFKALRRALEAPPETTIGSGPAGTTRATTASFAFSSSERGSSFECRLDSNGEADWQGCSSPKQYGSLGEGAHSFEVRARDPAGNADPSPASRTWTVDTQAPSLTIDSGPAGPTSESRPSFEFSAGAGATFECSIDAGTPGFGPCSGIGTHQPETELADGTYSFRVRATDAAGNASTETRGFTVDTQVPETSIVAGPDNTTNSSIASFSFWASEPWAKFECRLDAAAWSACASPKGYQGLVAGPHAFEVRARDPAGNTDLIPASRTWIVDTQAPLLTIDSGPVGPTSDNRPSFGFTAEEGAAVECSIDAGAPGFGPCSGAATHQPASGLADGGYIFRVRAADAAGNSVIRTRDFMVDTGAPGLPIGSLPSGPRASIAGSSSSPDPGSGTLQSPGAIPPAAPKRCVTPKLKGEKLASAKRGLKRANCALGRVKRKSGRKPGIVVSQRPKPGRTMPAGTKVSIVVGKR